MLSPPIEIDHLLAAGDNEAPMECSYAFVADAANQEAGGKLNVLGIFDRVTPEKYPYLHPQLFLVVTLTADPAEFGKKKEFEISLIDPDARILTTMKASGVVPRPDSGTKATMQIVLQMVNTPFPAPGPYAFSVLVNGDRKASIPLEAVTRKAPARRRRGNGGRKQGN